MPTWNEILDEITRLSNGFAPIDTVRREYLRRLYDTTGRNIICYYSGWLAKPSSANLDVSDLDMEGFMNVSAGLDRSRGLDLFLHTPGGNVAATESIVKYLRSMFGTNIRVIVPQVALSAGTMIACSAKEIVMGKQSSLGPIDPQLNGVAALNIIREFEEFESDIVAHPEKAMYWSVRLQGVSPAFIRLCQNAVAMASELVANWLKTGMFEDGNIYDAGFVDGIVNRLNENSNSKLHDRHISKEQCRGIGLKIVDLEANDLYQDAVLSVHHAYCITLSNTMASKIIENQNGAAVVRYT